MKTGVILLAILVVGVANSECQPNTYTHTCGNVDSTRNR